jgi:DNA primase
LRFPPEKIDEVRSATDIIDLVGSYVRLKKRGKNFVGLCPFHTEKTPSFNVSPERQMYHCFGCGVGGNAFTFVMEMEKVSFQEAVRTLAERAGIALPQASYVSEAEASEVEALYQACTVAARCFYSNLTETTEGKLALEYYHYRGFTDETIRRFGLGYAFNSWDALIDHARQQGIQADVLEKAGLVRKREDGNLYDYFRGRTIFPIFSTSGRVIGFGARKMREDDPLGKYINSPETPIYNKSRILYGMYQAKESIREKDLAILVEGYADLISVSQAGIANVVASSGTALTQEQTQLVARYTKNLVIVYDADSAGAQASLRGLEVALENDLDVRVAELPKGEDPDSFVKKLGGTAFLKLVDGAVSFVDFIAQTHEQRGVLQTPEGQAEAVRATVQAIAKMKDELKRQFYIRSVAEKYKLYESILYRELEKHTGRTPAAFARGTRKAAALAQGAEVNHAVAVQHTTANIPAPERDLLHAMLNGGSEVVDFVFREISPDAFTHPGARALCARIKDERDVNGVVDASQLLNDLEDENLKRLIAELVFSKYELSEETRARVAPADAEQLAADALKSLRIRVIEQQIEDNRRRLKEAAARGEDIIGLMEERQKLLENMKKSVAASNG